MDIPKQLGDFNFVLIGGNGKQPIEKGWQKKIHRIDDLIFQRHIKAGKNYGVQSNNSFIQIDGENRFLVVIDFDKKDFQDKVINQFPPTFTTTSGSPKNCFHLWFACDNNKAFKVKDEKGEMLCDMIGEGNQVIAPGSKHSSGSLYSVVKDIPIVFLPYGEIQAILKPHDKTPKKPKKPKKQYTPSNLDEDTTQKIINSVSMEEILSEVGIDTSKNPTGCFDHSSVGGKCLGWDEETAHCFHCDGSWNKFSLVRAAKKLTDKNTFDWFATKAGMEEELNKSRKEFVQSKNNPFKVFSLNEQVEKLNEITPLFYDKSGMFWLWNNKEKFWEMNDEVDILNMIHQATNQDIISSKARTEILNHLKQTGRLNTPEHIKPTWIQFVDKIYDIETGESFEASPKYFVTNPIPFKCSGDPRTPVMDRIFEEWVGKKYVPLLYEIIAYCLIPDYPINRLFCFIGSGLNGKSKFLELLQKFIGLKNVCSTELDTLILSRFEVTRLHKKLVCLMGETNFDEISKTSILKKLTGKDVIGFEYKNKTPFEDYNYAKILIATNNLPTTTDKTIGFYRRWCIIDFPNRFDEKKDILEDIPKEEYSNLATRCIIILNQLIKRRTFTQEGTIEERAEKYEAKSNFLEKFIKLFVDVDVDGFITKADFIKKFRQWSEENRHRKMSDTSIGLKMKELGYEGSTKHFDWMFDGRGGNAKIWVGMKWKN